jgi:hypothetical protein
MIFTFSSHRGVFPVSVSQGEPNYKNGGRHNNLKELVFLRWIRIGDCRLNSLFHVDERESEMRTEDDDIKLSLCVVNYGAAQKARVFQSGKKVFTQF